MNDTSAYFCGFFMGKKIVNKPLTALSPNKTWEGFIGAIFCTVAWGWFVSDYLAGWNWFICPRRLYIDDANNCNPPTVFVHQTYTVDELGGYTFTCRPIQLHMIALALFASIIAPFGGFMASGMKRAYNIKDFSSVIPGHGGFTDRMDCQFIMLFCTHVHYRTFIHSPLHTVAAIVTTASYLSGADQALLVSKLQSMIAANPGS